MRTSREVQVFEIDGYTCTVEIERSHDGLEVWTNIETPDGLHLSIDEDPITIAHAPYAVCRQEVEFLKAEAEEAAWADTND